MINWPNRHAPHDQSNSDDQISYYEISLRQSEIRASKSLVEYCLALILLGRTGAAGFAAEPTLVNLLKKICGFAKHHKSRTRNV